MTKTAAFFRRLLKVLLYIGIVIIVLYVALMFTFGGYGKKPANLSRPKTGNGLTLFAHRALSLYYPESSMLAVQGAKRKGFSGVELDIQKDGDGELIIFHDEDCEFFF